MGDITTVNDIKEWIGIGIKKGMDFLIVVCDTFDYDDYPVYCYKDEIEQTINKYNGKDMQCIREIYDLKGDVEKQLGENRSFCGFKVKRGGMI